MARLAAINNTENGGLNLVDLQTSIKSLRLAWLGRLFARRLISVESIYYSSS